MLIQNINNGVLDNLIAGGSIIMAFCGFARREFIHPEFHRPWFGGCRGVVFPQAWPTGGCNNVVPFNFAGPNPNYDRRFLNGETRAQRHPWMAKNQVDRALAEHVDLQTHPYLYGEYQGLLQEGRCP